MVIALNQDEIAQIQWKTKKDYILCGDSATILQEMPTEFVHLVITSPPYGNLKDYGEDSRNLGRYPFRQQVPLLLNIFGEINRILMSGRYFIFFFPDMPYPDDDSGEIFIDNPLVCLVPPLEEMGFRLKRVLIWRKPGNFSTMKLAGAHPPFPSFPCYFEYIVIMKKRGKGNYEHISAEERKRSLIPYKYLFQSLPIFDDSNELNIKKRHPAPFPVSLIQKLILMYSFVGETVLDPFLGSGTVAVAARTLERHFCGIELNPEYIQLAINRVMDEGNISLVDEINRGIGFLRGHFRLNWEE